MRNSDVLVIGGGLAGLVAACTAAEKGKKVQVLSYGAGTLTIGGGIIDAIGYTDDAKPVAKPSVALANVTAAHPYAKVGKSVVGAAFNAFKKITEAEGFAYIGDLDKNQWVPTAVGTLKPTCLTSKTMDASVLESAKDVLVVGFDTLKDFYAHIVAKNLKKIYGDKKSVSEAVVKLNFTGRDVNALDVSRWLDSAEGRNEFAAQIKDQVKPGMVVVVPPVLGTAPDYKVLEALEKGLSCKFIEVSAMPPSVTGYRLRAMLLNYARKLGVTIVEKAKVTASHVENGKCEYVVTEGFDRERKYYAKEFILATGGVYGGGLEAEIGKMVEPIFDLPIDVPEVQTDWSHKNLFSDEKQIFAQLGVTVNSSLTPVDAAGNELISNLKVVGRSLAGYDYCFEKSGNGVAIATAYKAAISL